MTSHARGSHRRRPWPHTELDDHEQGELALKLRYGIGLELLLSERDPMPPRRERSERCIPEPAADRPDHEVHARAAALGITAGRRGRWLRA